MKKLNVLLITSLCVAAVSPVFSPNTADAATDKNIVNENNNKTKSSDSTPDPDKYTKIKIEGETVYVSKTGNEWVNKNGYQHFVKNGKLVKGWYKLTKADGENTTHYSYFDKTNGRLYVGWHNMGKAEGEKTRHWSYFGGNGWLRTGWQSMGKGTGNSFGESKQKHYSYFGNNGWLRTGWQSMGRGTANSFEENNVKHMSYFGGDGWLRTGWQSMGKGTGNSFGESKQKHYSYFGNNGWLRTGLQNMATKENPDGKYYPHISYFGGNGWLVVNKKFTYNKKQYMADSSGWLAEVGTEHDQTLARAKQLVAKVTNSNMTKEQKLRACFVHIRDKYKEYRPRTPHYSGKGWDTLYANDIFTGDGGNCFSYAAALAYMARAIGYENVFAVYAKSHGWAEINGKVYDAEWEKNHNGSFYALKYEGSAYGNEKYEWIFSMSKPYSRVKI